MASSKRGPQFLIRYCTRKFPLSWKIELESINFWDMSATPTVSFSFFFGWEVRHAQLCVKYECDHTGQAI